ncbi:DUF3426 domain-containing protein [Geomesophilobacter sediminis]|uniref:Zinc-ribbon domain-containing protein n=1 Tax=Geomesophilobacter sediminis TaxID=2798584 RepID=A0A8J7IN22_9BACT|nr:DUF3426 domain-containing protein [Geomesophilobacter sediminis]MBJ6724428.1 zinc-ribbon domain-containing protein [Geomesophilobacter sediminis]
MILQCEQCKTRFRLDDSKLKPGGVKVRCSKCRHVFLAGVETTHDESEFDAVLSGLGAPAPQVPEPAAPAATSVPAAEPGFAPPAEEPPASEEFAGFGEEPCAETPAAVAAEPAGLDAFAPFEAAAPESAAASVEEPPPFGEFSFEEPAAASAAATTEAEVDFGAFSFEEPASPAEAAAPTAVETTVDFSEFSFEEQAPAAPEAPAPEAETGGFGYQEFSFEEPAAHEAPAAPAAAPTEALDFGELSFEGAPTLGATPQAGTETAAGFQEFSFEEEPPALPTEPATSGEPLDFGSLSFEEPAPAVAPAESPVSGPTEFSFEEPVPTTPAAAESVLDFGELSFETPPAPAAEPAASTSDFDFSFEEPAAKSPAASESVLDFGEFALETPPAAAPATEGAPAVEAAAPVPPQPAPPGGESLDFGDFSFDQDLFKKDAGKEATAAFPSFLKPESAPGVAAPAEPGPLAAAGEPELDEVPPFPVSPRRKGRSVLTVSLVTISVVAVVALSGAGLYLMQNGPAAFDKVGLGFVATWFGMESPEEGKIAIRNAQASFHQNKDAGELFVVTGQAVNSFKKARASIHIKVTLYDKAGKPILQKTAYCGNKLTDDQLATLPIAKIDSIMNNQFGDSLSNMGVQPGKSIPFVVAIANVPKEAADFGVESIGSTVSSP